MGVEVGKGVLEGCGVTVTWGVGVQVDGMRTGVGVEVGMSMVGIKVAGGKGLREEFGLLKMVAITMMMITVPIRTSMERTSQTLIFSFIDRSPPNQGYAQSLLL
jgi:hypothetical protein